MPKTLQQQIEANKRGSLIFGFVLVILLAAVGGAAWGTYDPKHWWYGAAGAGVLGLIVSLVAWSSGPNIVLSISKAREATPQEDQVLRNVTEEMAIAAGIPMPQLYVIQDSAPNAFATGKDPRSGVVCVTTGLIAKLDRDELQGVVAHEIGHIRNYDIRFMTSIALIAGLIPMIADFYLRSMWWSGGGSSRRRSDDNNSGLNPFVIIGIVLAIIAPLFAKLLELAVSRKREFLADATAAQLTRYPEGLAKALIKISNDPDPLEVANRGTEHMFIVNPFKGAGQKMMAMLSTHPPVEDRVRALMGIAGNKMGALEELR